MDIDLKQLRELMRSLKQWDVHELEIQRGEERILLRRNSESSGNVWGHPVVAPTAPASIPPLPPDGVIATGSLAPKEQDLQAVFITSPFVGTFYRAPGPNTEPFVQVGAKIEPGQVLCIVEAMKLMNEIESDMHGIVVEALVENGKPVEYGEKLFKVKKIS